jgi:hypothetical protein
MHDEGIKAAKYTKKLGIPFLAFLRCRWEGYLAAGYDRTPGQAMLLSNNYVKNSTRELNSKLEMARILTAYSLNYLYK